jgi:predicted sugar kinase
MREIECMELAKVPGWGPALYAVVKQEQAKPTLKKIKKY